MCGTLNPTGNVYCDHCSARIVPLSTASSQEQEDTGVPMKGVSLPSIPLAEVPDQQGATRATEESRSEEAADDWLTQLHGSATKEEGVPTGATEPSKPEVAFSDDWMSQLRASASGDTTGAQGRTEPTESADEPDLMRDDEHARLVGIEPMSSVGSDLFAEREAEEDPMMPAVPEIPDWLRAMSQPETPDPAPSPPSPGQGWEELPSPTAAEIPAWLQEISASPDVPAVGSPPTGKTLREEAPTEEPTAVETEVPDWVRGVKPPEDAADATVSTAEQRLGQTPTVAPYTTEAMVPGWLQEIAASEDTPIGGRRPPAEPVVEERSAEALAPAVAEIPDWLREVAPPENTLVVGELSPGTPVLKKRPDEPLPLVPAEIPDWLREVAPSEAGPTEEVSPVTRSSIGEMPTSGVPPIEADIPFLEETPSEAARPVQAGIPDWLEETAPSGIGGETVLASPPPFVSAPPVGDIETPNWLLELAPPEPSVVLPPAARVSPFLEESEEAQVTEAPGWLADLEQEPVSTQESLAHQDTVPLPPLETGAGAPEGERLARAEIPDWLLSLRPATQGEAGLASMEPAETTGLLEGLRGVIPPSAVVTASGIRESALPRGPTEASLSRAHLLQSLLAQPVEAPKVAQEERSSNTVERTLRWLVGVVLLVTTVGSLALRSMVPLPTLTQPDESRAIEMYNIIEGSTAGDTVLVAFEYGPAEADELNLVARPILQHLLDREAHVSAVSTRPEGLAVAGRLLSSIRRKETPSDYYTLSAYRAGGATGVAQLLAGVEPRPSLVVVLTAQPGPLRWWIEQTNARYAHDGPALLAGVSALLEVAASPYLAPQVGQLSGSISGLNGAAAYESLSEMESGRASRRLDALAVGHVAIVGLIILGLVIYLPSSLLRKRRN